ncbi:hypothetical protein [Parasporobacterium paucivorans]|uniref:Uncharacterized protein n=1 Tax=Parasporobacterium paucivorans DSM 15970 TaxID=1122934 RepID=A0A1M6JSK4_9FIRM|nr:hypothetical protein [Parasporobacterium paucivorans]SHJ49653.1 hypothetical protein SAMN02745691_02056 [Parasporobacterium paucivorans DSM 15970]
MAKILMIKELAKQIYNRHERYVTMGLRFLLVLCSLFVISFFAGFSSIFSNPLIIVVVAIVCAFLPMNIDLLVILLVILAHFYALAPEVALAAILIFIVMYLMYFRYTFQYSLAVMLLPVLFFLKIPLVVPLILGCVATPVTIIPTIFGAIIYFMLQYASESASLLNSLSSGSGVTKMTMLFDAVFSNQVFYLTVIALAAALTVVYAIRRMSVNYAPLVAVSAGGLANVIIMLGGYIALGLSKQISIAAVIVGSIVAVGVGYVIQAVVFSVDYSRTEYTQFEDEDFIYYVKAVPKVSLGAQKVNVKRINVQRINVQRIKGRNKR